MGRIVNFSYFIFGDEEFFELGVYALTSLPPLSPLKRGGFDGACLFVN